jgi:hypothetical protein
MGVPEGDRLTSVCCGNISFMVPLVTLGLHRGQISDGAFGANLPKHIYQKLCQMR